MMELATSTATAPLLWAPYIEGLDDEPSLKDVSGYEIEGLDSEETQLEARGVVWRKEPHQQKFIDSRKLLNAFVGGRGTGKTHALSIKLYEMCRENPGLPHICAGQTARSTRDIVVPVFMDYLAFLGVVPQWEKTAAICTLPNGSSVQFLSGENHKRWPGRTVAGAALDEPGLQPHEAFKQAVAVTRETRASLRQVLLSGTGEGFNWYYEEFGHGDDAQHSTTFASTDQNAHNLPDDYAENLTRMFGKRLGEQYRGGRFVDARSGRVYDEAQRDKYAAPVAYEPHRRLEIWLDFNANPAVGGLSHREADRHQVFGEIFLEDSGTLQVCNEIVARTQDHRGGAVVYGDASGGQKTANSQRSNWEIVRQILEPHFSMRGGIEFRYRRSNPAQLDRVNSVNMCLRRKWVLVNIEACPMLVKDFAEVLWKPGTHDILKPKEGEGAKRTHISDALGYMLHVEHPVRVPQLVGQQPVRYK